ncbi:MAG: hypothetical protein JWM68_454 [Verrucomicrobiales bacterium]|nr:hypothetical protein [Verrucomicrobiales bacterium]
MGNFYTNYTLRGPSQQAVASALAGRSAIVTPTQDGCVVVFDEQSDGQDSAVITELASRLSRELRCPVLAVLNHDDDIFWYHLYLNGKLADEYDSSPGYFDASAEPSAPAGGDAQKLCSAFGAASVAEVESVLRKSSFDEGGYTFAVERHTDLVRALGIPSFGVGAGFRYVADGELPEGLDDEGMLRVGESESSGGITSYTEYQHIITNDPKIRNGEPCIRGLPIAVSDIYDYVAAGMTPEQIIAKHSELTVEDVMACLLFIAHHYPKKS